MNKTKIDWATMSWNPVTGCRHGCPYCYARRTATRFNAGLEDPASLAGGLHVLPEKIKATPYPYGFEPTLHRYRLGQPQNTEEPQTVFVCSMADLFGRWVPTSWIVEVLDTCRKAPQHRYLFLTKNPARYLELDHLALLPHESNFWYGSTVANMDAVGMYVMQGVNINSFWSMEPLLGPVDMAAAEGLPEWVILGAETGNRPDKVTPAREWVDNIVAFARRTRSLCSSRKICGSISRISLPLLSPGRCEPWKTPRKWRSVTPCRKNAGRKQPRTWRNWGTCWPLDF